MSNEFYACYCVPKRSIGLALWARENGYAVDCPSFSFRRRLPRRKKVEILRKPLIGGFVFVGVDDYDLLLRKGWQAGVDLSRLKPAQVTGQRIVLTESEVDWLIVQGDRMSGKRSELKVGDRVRIFFGPFQDMEGNITEKTERAFVVDLGGLLSRSEIAPFLLKKTQA
jgi:transcription antitermination factor NusG